MVDYTMAMSLLLLPAMLTLVAAQSSSLIRTSRTSSRASTRTTASTGSATHTVKVGPMEAPHQYVPNSVNASIGDSILFEFYPRNHSVVQADYKVPCVPSRGDIFYSGAFNDFNENDGFLVGDVSTRQWYVYPVLF